MNSVVRMSAGELPPGIVVIARFEEGSCASGRIISHRGARITPDGASFLVSIDDAEAVHYTFQRKPADALGEPYQQSGAAYLPLDLSRLQTTTIAGYGVMLVEKSIRRLGLDTRVADDGFGSLFRVVTDMAELRAVFGEIMERAGVPAPQRRSLSAASLPALTA